VILVSMQSSDSFVGSQASKVDVRLLGIRVHARPNFEKVATPSKTFLVHISFIEKFALILYHRVVKNKVVQNSLPAAPR
jgi:hypothetical protein